MGAKKEITSDTDFPIVHEPAEGDLLWGHTAAGVKQLVTVGNAKASAPATTGLPFPWSLTELNTGTRFTYNGVTGWVCYKTFQWESGALPQFTNPDLTGVEKTYEVLQIFWETALLADGSTIGHLAWGVQVDNSGTTYKRVYWNNLDTSKGAFITVVYIKP